MRNILFLCTGNSARSIMAEGYMNAVGKGQWRAYSAGSNPTGTPNPYALATLAATGMAVENSRSKSWDEYTAEDAPFIDVVVTVCDNAAGETCPVWPKRAGVEPTKLHWSFPDPAVATGDEAAIRGEFEIIFANIKTRINALIEEYDR